MSSFGFGPGGEGSFSASSSRGPSSRMSDEERAQSLRVTMETIEVGRETAAQVQDQGERLSRTERVMDSTQYVVDKSAHVLRSMSFMGRIRNMFLDEPKLRETRQDGDAVEGFICPDCLMQFSDQDELAKHYGTAHGTGGGTVSGMPQAVGTATKDQLDIMRAQQEYMSALGPAVQEVSALSLALSQGISSQNATLDRLDDKSATLHHDTMFVTRKTARMVKKKRQAGKGPPQTVAIAYQDCFLCVSGDSVFLRRIQPPSNACRWEVHGGELGIVGFRSALSGLWLGQGALGGIYCKGSKFGRWEEWQCDGTNFRSFQRTRLICCSANWGGGGFLCAPTYRSEDGIVTVAAERELFLRPCSASDSAAGATYFEVVPLDDADVSPYANGPLRFAAARSSSSSPPPGGASSSTARAS